jgi:hypothetical protein
MKALRFCILLFIFLMTLVSNSFSDAGTNDDCANAEIVINMNNVNITKSESITGTLTNGTDKQDYYKFTVGANGTLEINSASNIAIDFFVGNTCTGSTCGTEYYNGSVDSTSHSSGVFYVSSGTTVYFKLDKNGAVSYTVDIDFILGSNSPIAVNDTADTNGTESVTIDVLNNDYDVDGSLIPSSVTIVTAPTKGTITNINTTTGEITYSPTSFDIVGDSFTYTVQDNNNNTSNTATVTITYPIPVAYDKVYSVIPSGTLNGNVITDSPVDPNYADHNHTMNANSTPAVGTLSPATITSDGSFTYTATAATGTASFTFSVINKYGMISNTATAYIYVNQYCANAITLLSTDMNCSTNDTNSTIGSVTADGGQYYEIVLAEDGVLDINLTNTDPQTGGTILYYDFGGEPCGSIFAKGTTSQIDAGYRSKTASIVLSAGTYYLGLQGKSNTNPTDYNIEVTFRSACPGGPPIYPTVLSSIGINEPGIDYDLDKNITTKIVNKPFNLRASYLDASGSVAPYDGRDVVDGMTVIINHADGDECTNPTIPGDTIGQGIILDGDEFTTVIDMVIDTAYQNRRTKITALDWGALLEDADGLNCNNSSLNSGLCLVPACFNNVQNIRSVFPPAFQPHVMTCIYGDGSGNDAPCDSMAYYGNCGGTKGDISPVKYNVDLGCAMCLADAMQGDQCSPDAFAIRPNDFNTTIAPNQIFLAGEATPLTFTAEDFTNAASNNYNENENTSFTVDIEISDSNKTCAEPSIKFSPIVDFTNGIAANSYTLNNVGDFNLTMHETLGAEFALVDEDDTNESLRLIEPFATQIKVIPHHFGIDGNLTNGADSKLFTYLSNFEQFDTNESRNVSASLDLNVSAEAENNTTTSNYTSLCYAKDGNLKLTLANAIDKDNPEVDSLTKLLWYHYTPDNNGSILLDGVTTEYNLPFLSTQFDSNDTNGTAEFNYKINFDRNLTKVVNPFIVIVNEINATDSDNVSGVKAGGNATFVFGRSHASRQRFVVPTDDPYTANIYFESYCFGTGCDKTLLNGFSPNMQRTDDVRWYVNEVHTVPNDGLAGTVTEKAAIVNVTATAPTVANPSQTNLTYTGNKGYPYKTTMHNNASPWLIYNESDPTATRNEFQVEFDTQGGWTGKKETDTTTKTPDAATTNRRIMW